MTASTLSRRSVAPALALAGMLAPVAPVHAAELATRGALQCPPAEELVFRIERAIGMPLAKAAPLRLSVAFDTGQRPGARYTARVEIDGDTPSRSHLERQLGAESCAELADAVSVALALALGADDAAPNADASSAAGPNGAGHEAVALPPQTPAVVRTVPSPDPSRVPAGEDTPEARRERESKWLTPLLTLALVGDSGSLPAPGLGLELGAALRWQRLAVRAAAMLLFDQHVALASGVGGGTSAPGADMSLALGSLSACTSVFGNFQSPFGVSACAGWELGRLAAMGTGVQTPRRGAMLWSAPRVDAGVSWAASRTPLRLGLQLGVATPLVRDDFFLRDLGTLHQPPSVVGRLAAGIDVSFE